MSARGTMRAMRAHNSSPEWYTPDWLMGRIVAFLGSTYYDPCPPRLETGERANGLAVTWRGRVYVNPPYGRAINPWIVKAMTEPVDELVLLVPAYTDTGWFAPLFEHTICFVRGRIYFRTPHKRDPEMRSPGPSVLVYRGERTAAFADAFSDLGPIIRAYRPHTFAQPRLLEVGA